MLRATRGLEPRFFNSIEGATTISMKFCVDPAVAATSKMLCFPRKSWQVDATNHDFHTASLSIVKSTLKSVVIEISSATM